MNFKAKIVRTVAAAGLALVMTTGVAFASLGTATVTADSLRLRSEANTTSTTITQAPRGSTVTVESEAGNGWYKVTYGSKTGYMSSDWLTLTLANGDVIPATEGTEPAQSKGIVTASVLNVRSGPGSSYSKVSTLKSGTAVEILADVGNGWYQIEGGYVSAEYISLGGADSKASSLGTAAAALAKKLVGSRYVYGATGPYSFDCSGLTYYIYKKLGHPITRSASNQYYNNGYFVSINDMQPGDLVFFFDRAYDGSGGTLPVTHVGIYVGNGQFVHASTPSSGVRYDSIVSGYHANHVVAVKRIG